MRRSSVEFDVTVITSFRLWVWVYSLYSAFPGNSRICPFDLIKVIVKKRGKKKSF